MKIAFWNIRKNKNPKLVFDLVDRFAPDILFLAECPDSVFHTSRSHFHALQGRLLGKPKVRGFIVSDEIKCNVIQEIGERFSVYRVSWAGYEIILGALHLSSKMHTSDEVLGHQAHVYMGEIRSLEKRENNKNTVIIGDFNMNPFESGMILPYAFNSVCSKRIAAKGGRTCAGIEYDYFYNPAWANYAGFGSDLYGTYFHHSCKKDGFHWNNFDQALLRPGLMQDFDCEFSVLHDLFDLQKQNTGFSDHYPILLELKEK